MLLNFRNSSETISSISRFVRPCFSPSTSIMIAYRCACERKRVRIRKREAYATWGGLPAWGDENFELILFQGVAHLSDTDSNLSRLSTPTGFHTIAQGCPGLPGLPWDFDKIHDRTLSGFHMILSLDPAVFSEFLQSQNSPTNGLTYILWNPDRVKRQFSFSLNPG